MPDEFTANIIISMNPSEPIYKWYTLDTVEHFNRETRQIEKYVVARVKTTVSSRSPVFANNEEWAKLKSERDNHPIKAEIYQEERRQKSLQLLERSDIWRRFADRTLWNFDDTLSETHKAIKWKAYEYIDNRQKNAEKWKWLYLSWWVWIWKTHIVCWIIHELIERYQTSVLYKPTPNLLQEIKSTYSDKWESHNKETESKIIARCKNAELLILDDIWTEKPSERVVEILYTIINDRYEAYKPTIFTSNIKVSELWERIWARIADRIYDMCDVLDLSRITKSYRWTQRL